MLIIQYRAIIPTYDIHIHSVGFGACFVKLFKVVAIIDYETGDSV